MIPVTARQVFSSVVEEHHIFDDLAIGKHSDALNITFTKYPVRTSIVIREEESSGLPCIELIATTQRNTSFPISKPALNAGHAVHESTWYPCDEGSTAVVSKLLGEISYNPDDFTLNSISDILHLKHSSYSGLPVIDNLSDQSISKLLKQHSKDSSPFGISARLYPYQHDGWNWLYFILREELGAVLADEMGLGKTLQTICAISEIKLSFPDAHFLVICPGSILENWRREFSHFCSSLTIHKHHGPSRTGSPKFLTNYDIVITSYDTAVRDLSLFKMINWWAVILDEAQNIRNPTTRRSKCIKQIPRKAGVAVTGTPIENRLRDIWSIFDFIAPNYLGKLDDFERRFVDDEIAARELEPAVSPLMLRRTVSEVAGDLPDRIDILELLEFTPDEASAYENVRASIFQKHGQSATLASIVGLQQFCSHPGIMDVQLPHGNQNFTKFQRLIELVEEIALRDEKVLVFTTYNKMADMIASIVRERFSSPTAIIDGRVNPSRRQELIDEFSNDPNFLLLALNPKAAGTGLNISAANHVIHYNPVWNPALMDQATARSYRRGQRRPVTVRRLIFCDSVEEVMEERLQRKRVLADGAVVGVKGAEEDYSDIISALNRTPMKKR